jgi:hypothetical protein
MKGICVVALTTATVIGTLSFAVDDASAAERRGGVNRAGVHRVGVNRVGMNRVGVDRGGMDRAGIEYRPALATGNRLGWNGNWDDWNRPGLRTAAASLAIGATAATAYNYGSNNSGYYENSYYPTHAQYGTLRGTGNIGPVCNPWVDRLCQ